MNLDQFTVFAAVAKHRNVTRAAEELCISQPAVTKHLRLLEENYNAKLYRRGGKGIELTAAGKLFLRNSKTILKQHERLKQRLSSVSSKNETPTLLVGASYSPSVSLLPSLLATFEKSHPHVQIDFRTADRADIDRMMLNSEIELAIVNNAILNHSLVLEPYRHEPLAVFASSNHPLAKKQKITWQDLEQTPFIARKQARGRSTSNRFFENMRKLGFKPGVAMRCSSPEAVKAAVKRKMGMGILFKETIAPEVRKGEFKIIKVPGGNFEGQSFIVYRKDRPLSPNAQEFLALLRKGKEKRN